MNIDLEELQTRWSEYDRKLDASIRLNRELLRHTNVARVDSALARFAFIQALELGANLVAVVALGSFWFDQLAVPSVALCAGVLDAYLIGTLIAFARQIVAARSIDYAAPVTSIQRKLEDLRIEHIRSLQVILLAAPVMWAPLLVVTCRLLFGMNVYTSLGAPFFWTNVAVGVAVIPLALWAVRVWRGADRFRLLSRLREAFAGDGLAAARRHLAALAEFEADPVSG